MIILRDGRAIYDTRTAVEWLEECGLDFFDWQKDEFLGYVSGFELDDRYDYETEMESLRQDMEDAEDRASSLEEELDDMEIECNKAKIEAAQKDFQISFLLDKIGELGEDANDVLIACEVATKAHFASRKHM